MFFEEYTNFEAHYLSHCRVIPLKSFKSRIRPKPHGLGLRGGSYNPPPLTNITQLNLEIFH